MDRVFSFLIWLTSFPRGPIENLPLRFSVLAILDCFLAGRGQWWWDSGYMHFFVKVTDMFLLPRISDVKKKSKKRQGSQHVKKCAGNRQKVSAPVAAFRQMPGPFLILHQTRLHPMHGNSFALTLLRPIYSFNAQG